MPKISKASKIVPRSTKPGAPPPEKDKLDKYICSRCGKIYVRQKNNFPASQSPLFAGSGGYLPVCNHCIDNLFDHYKEALGGGDAAMERICMKFDIYWNPDIYGMINKVNSSASRVRQYISKTFLIKYIGRTYDDTLDERAGMGGTIMLSPDTDDETAEGVDVLGRPTGVDARSITFWGKGFDAEAYKDLNARFERWTSEKPKPLDIVEESLYKQICIQEMSIARNAAAGKDIEKGQNALNNLLSSLNIKPNQRKDDSADADIDGTPLGVWARRWEEKRPIPDDDIPEPKLIKYITTWFFGHLGKAFNLRNVHSKLYEEAMDKYRVVKPEFEGEDDDEVMVDIFGGDDSGGDPQ